MLPLIEAVKRKNREEINEVIEETADINACDERKLTALMHACLNDDIETIQLILKHKDINIDVHDQSINRRVALMMAAPISGDYKKVSTITLDILASFLNYIELNFEKEYKITLNYLLHYYSWIGDIEKINRCLSISYVDLNYVYLGTSPLSLAAKYGHKEAVEIFLKYPSVNINIPDYRDDTPIITAMVYGHYEIAKILIEDPKCKFNHRSYLFGTPLLAAIHFDQKEIAFAIIDKLNSCDLEYEIPSFLLSIQKGPDWEKLFYKFLDNGMNVNASIKEFEHWLDSAPEWLMHEASAKFSPFFGQGSTAEERGYIFDRPIWVALHCNNRFAIKFLLGLGVHLDTPSESFLRIDKWYQSLPLEDDRKAFSFAIHENAGSYTLIDLIWDSLLELKEEASGVIFALQHESIEQTKAVAEYAESKFGIDGYFSRHADIFYAAYHDLWCSDTELWERHAKYLLIEKSIEIIFGKLQNTTLHHRLVEVARDKLIQIVKGKVKDYCSQERIEIKIAPFSEEDTASLSLTSEKSDSEKSSNLHELITTFNQSFEWMVNSIDHTDYAIPREHAADEKTAISKSSFIFHKPTEASRKFSNIDEIIQNLKTDDLLFAKIYHLVGLTAIPIRQRDKGKVLGAVKTILKHEFRQETWSELKDASGYYHYRIWNKQGKIEQLTKLCKSAVESYHTASYKLSSHTASSMNTFST